MAVEPKRKLANNVTQGKEIDPYRTTDKFNRHTEDGHEVLNPTPVQPPVGYVEQPNMWDQVRAMVANAKALAINMEPETEEEADDFEIEEDPPIPSRWENDTIPSIKQVRANIKELEEAERRYAAPPKPDTPELSPPEKPASS